MKRWYVCRMEAMNRRGCVHERAVEIEQHCVVGVRFFFVFMSIEYVFQPKTVFTLPGRRRGEGAL